MDFPPVGLIEDRCCFKVVNAYEKLRSLHHTLYSTFQRLLSWAFTISPFSFHAALTSTSPRQNERLRRKEVGQKLITVRDRKRKTNNKQEARKGRGAEEVCLFPILQYPAWEP